MTNELEPCPFCGGEVKLDRNFIICDTCAVRMERAIVYPRWHEHTELIQRWNTRYKRTCKMEPDPDYDLVVCSECGYEEEIHLLFPSSGDQVYDGKFCPSCGAEVVDDN